MLHVRLHGRQAEIELLGDIGEALPGGNQVQDLLLARSQRGGVVVLAEADLGARPAATSGGTTFSPRAQAIGIDDLLPARFLRDEASGTGLERLVDDATVHEGRDEQNPDRKLLARDGVCDRHAVELGELVVEQGHVGKVLVDLGECVPAVLSLGDDLDPAARRERSNDPSR